MTVLGSSDGFYKLNHMGTMLVYDRFYVPYEYTILPNLARYNAMSDTGTFGDDDTLGSYTFLDTHAFNNTYNPIATFSEVNPVPLPAAAWLFGSGLLGLIGFYKRKKAAL